VVLIQLGWMLVFFSFLVAYARPPKPWWPYVLLAAGAAVFAVNLVLELVSEAAGADPATAGAVGAVAVVLGVIGVDVGTKAGERRGGGGSPPPRA
jgi:hypothetical protein